MATEIEPKLYYATQLDKNEVNLWFNLVDGEHNIRRVGVNEKEFIDSFKQLGSTYFSTIRSGVFGDSKMGCDIITIQVLSASAAKKVFQLAVWMNGLKAKWTDAKLLLLIYCFDFFGVDPSCVLDILAKRTTSDEIYYLVHQLAEVNQHTNSLYAEYLTTHLPVRYTGSNFSSKLSSAMFTECTRDFAIDYSPETLKTRGCVIYDTTKGRAHDVITSHKISNNPWFFDGTNVVTANPTRPIIAIAKNDQILLYGVFEREIIETITLEWDARYQFLKIRQICFAMDGSMMYVISDIADSTSRIHKSVVDSIDLDQCKLIQRHLIYEGEVTKARVSPDGHWLAIANYRHISLINLLRGDAEIIETGSQVSELDFVDSSTLVFLDLSTRHGLHLRGFDCKSCTPILVAGPVDSINKDCRGDRKYVANVRYANIKLVQRILALTTPTTTGE